MATEEIKLKCGNANSCESPSSFSSSSLAPLKATLTTVQIAEGKSPIVSPSAPCIIIKFQASHTHTHIHAHAVRAEETGTRRRHSWNRIVSYKSVMAFKWPLALVFYSPGAINIIAWHQKLMCHTLSPRGECGGSGRSSARRRRKHLA